MKVATIYEGLDAEETKRSVLKGKKTIAGMENSTEFHEKREAQIRSIYNADEIQYRLLNGDGGSWIKDPYEPDTIFQLDRFHIRQEIKRKLNEDEEARTDVEALFEAEMTDEMLEYIEMYINSVDSDEERDKRAKKTIEILSAAKAPKKDGKGNSYADVINMHVPLREAIQTAGRRAMLQICL